MKLENRIRCIGAAMMLAGAGLTGKIFYECATFPRPPEDYYQLIQDIGELDREISYTKLPNYLENPILEGYKAQSREYKNLKGLEEMRDKIVCKKQEIDFKFPEYDLMLFTEKDSNLLDLALLGSISLFVVGCWGVGKPRIFIKKLK